MRNGSPLPVRLVDAGLDIVLTHDAPAGVQFAEIAGVPCIGLNKVGRPGNLVAVEIGARGREWSVLGEWPTV